MDAIYHYKIFVQLNKIYDINTYLNNSNLKLILNKTRSNDYFDFFSNLAQFNRLKSANKNEKYIDAIEIKVMLPENITSQQLEHFIKEYSKNFNNLPFIALMDEEMTGKYILFVISERFYNKNKKTIKIKYTADVFMNTNTNGKKVFCKKDAPGAELIHKKGEIKREINDSFSNKIRLFCGPKAEIIKITNRLKVKCLIILKTLFNMTKCTSRFIRVQRKKGKNDYEKANIKDINKFLIYADERLLTIEEYQIEKYDSMLKLRNELRAIINSSEFKRIFKTRKEFYHYFKVIKNKYYRKIEILCS